MINISQWALDNKKLVYFLLLVLTLGGVFAYVGMSKLEDPEIKVKQAAVLTLYPGAGAHEVEMEVSDKLEKSIRSMSQVKEVTSESMNDASLLMVTLKTTTPDKEVEQTWDMLRRKVRDVQSSLPSGAGESLVLDNFGDVYGMFYALVYDGYSNEEATKYADLIAREAQKIEGISQVSIYGKQKQTINIDLYEDKIANLGIHPAIILSMLKGQNETIYSGYYEAGGQRLRVSVSDRYRTVEDISNLVLQGSQGDKLRLGDIARVTEGYESPTRLGMRFDGKQALGISISASSGTDITKLGVEVEQLVRHLEETRLPAGIKLQKVFFQPDRVNEALDNFIVNLIESVLIVVVILVLFMGYRSGIILGTGLLITVVGSIMFLNAFGGTIQRVSLAAFILAMGMLVDNAIVVLDGIQNDLEQGVERSRALTATSIQTAMPLLGATLIAILSFLPIYLSPDTAGVYVRDLFIVLSVSLLLSWVLALVLNPLMADVMYRNVKKKEGDLYSGKFYTRLDSVVRWILGHRIISSSIVGVLIFISLWAAKLLPQGFFPDMEYDQLYIEYRLPEGYTTEAVDRDLRQIESHISSLDHVKHITTSIGATPSRYNLVRSVATSSLSYGELIVDFDSPRAAVESIDSLQTYLSSRYPEAQVRVKRYNLMYKEYPIELQFTGPDPAVLRQLTSQALEVMNSDERTLMARSNWFPKIPSVQVQYNQATALNSGLSRRDIGLSLMASTYGIPMGTFYDGIYPKTITIRSVDREGRPIESLEQAPLFSTTPNLQALNGDLIQGIFTGAIGKEQIVSEILKTHPLSGVTDGVTLQWEEADVRRYNGERAIKAQAMPREGVSTETLRAAFAQRLDSLQLPEGYSMKWDGEYSASQESTTYLFMYYPLAVVLMVAILIMLFGDYRKPIIVFLCLPTLAVGIVWGVLLSGKVFGFTAIVAVLGLVGMMIKNVIVLLDEVGLQISQGLTPYEALILSAKSRVRPVMLASLTTILGMIPLLPDALFGPLAVVVMSGLVVGTLATILVTPLLYAIFFGVKTPEEAKD